MLTTVKGTEQCSTTKNLLAPAVFHKLRSSDVGQVKMMRTALWLERQQASNPRNAVYIRKDAGTYALYVLTAGSPDMSACHMSHSKASTAPFYEKDKTLAADWSHQLPL